MAYKELIGFRAASPALILVRDCKLVSQQILIGQTLNDIGHEKETTWLDFNFLSE